MIFVYIVVRLFAFSFFYIIFGCFVCFLCMLSQPEFWISHQDQEASRLENLWVLRCFKANQNKFCSVLIFVFAWRNFKNVPVSILVTLF